PKRVDMLDHYLTAGSYPAKTFGTVGGRYCRREKTPLLLAGMPAAQSQGSIEVKVMALARYGCILCFHNSPTTRSALRSLIVLLCKQMFIFIAGNYNNYLDNPGCSCNYVNKGK